MYAEQIAKRDGAPGLDIVQDFYKEFKLEPRLLDRWEKIDEGELDTLDVPGELDTVPYSAWNVTIEKRRWIIYMWYENSSRDGETYVYEEKL